MGWEDRPYYRDRGQTSGNPFTWLLTGSVPLFTVFGIRVRAHASLVLTVGLVLVLGLGQGFTWQDRVESMSMLFLIVLLHEFGHCFTARWVGGHAEDILMTPLGGLAFASAPRRPLPQFLTVAGGPAVNVVICLLCGVYLYFVGWPVPISLLRIQGPPTFEGWLGVNRYLYWMFLMSWGLLLFNLWPIYPLDGGQMVQAILWPRVGYYKSMKFAAVTGMVGSVVMAMVGLASGGLFLLLIAVSCFMTCFMMHQQLKQATPYDFDEDQPDYSASAFMKDPKPRRQRKGGWFARRARAAADEAAEQRKIDAILAKVSAQGMHSLTWFEKRALRQATERQRQRDLEFSRKFER